MFVLMAAVAKVADVIAKITRDFCVVHEHGPCLSAQRPAQRREFTSVRC